MKQSGDKLRRPEPVDDDGYRQDKVSLVQDCDDVMLRCLAVLHAGDEAALFQQFIDECSDGEPFDRPELDASISALIQTHKRRRCWQAVGARLYKYGSLAAVFLCVCAVGLTTLFFTVDAVKLNVIGFVVDAYEEATDFNVEAVFGEIPESSPEITSETFREPEYIPDGFEIRYASVRPDQAIVFYNKEQPPDPQPSGEVRRKPGLYENKERINYSCMTLNVSITLDTEDCTRTAVSINGNEGFAYTKFRGPSKGRSSVIWHDNDYIYLITGSVSEKEMIKIAKSVPTA